MKKSFILSLHLDFKERICYNVNCIVVLHSEELKVIEFFKAGFSGAYDFWEFIKILGDFFNMIGATVIKDELTISSILTSPGLYSYILAAVGAVFLFYGRKFFPLIKFVVFAAIGFVVGNAFAYPALMVYMAGSVIVTPITCGVTVAIIGAALSQYLYGIVYLGAGAIFAYVICFAGGLIPGLPTVGNSMLSYIAVAIVVLVLIIMRKNISRLGLSVAGAYFIVEAVSKNFYKLESPMNFIAMGAVALIGFAFQYKNRKKYF